MKRIILALFVVIAAILVINCQSYADDIGNGKPVDATANVPQNIPPHIVIDLRRVESQEGLPDKEKGPYAANTFPATSMNFGPLEYKLKNGDLAGGFYAPVSYCAVAYVTPFNGTAYIIKSKGELTGADTPNNDIRNAFLLTSYYNPDDLLYDNTKDDTKDITNGPIDTAIGEVGKEKVAQYFPALQENDNLLKGKHSHVLQLWYSLPAYSEDGTPYFTGWAILPYSLPGNMPISAKVTITVYTTA